MSGKAPGGKGSSLAYILLIVLIILILIAFILSIVQLVRIKATTGFNLSTSLQNAYAFSITVLVFNLYVLIFLIMATIILFRNGGARSGSFLTLLVISLLSLLGAIILCGLAAAGSKNGVAIGNLVLMIIAFIVGIVLLYYAYKLPPYSLKELEKCATLAAGAVGIAPAGAIPI